MSITKWIDLNNRRKSEKTESALHPSASFLLHNFYTFHFVYSSSYRFFQFSFFHYHKVSNVLHFMHPMANVYFLSQMRKPTIFSSNTPYYFPLFFCHCCVLLAIWVNVCWLKRTQAREIWLAKFIQIDNCWKLHIHAKHNCNFE